MNHLQAKFLKFYYPSPDSSTRLPMQLLLSFQFSGGFHGSLFNFVETSQIRTSQEVVNTANSAAFVGRPKVNKKAQLTQRERATAVHV